MNNNQKQQMLKIGSLILSRAALVRKKDILDTKIQESKGKQERIQAFLLNQGISESEMTSFLLQNGIEVK